mgnify:FL=1
MGVRLVGAELLLFAVALQCRPGCEVALVHHAQRTDDRHGKLAHLQPGGHRAELALERKVEQQRVQDVVLMVAQRNFVATQFLRHGEEHLPAVPRTEEAGAFARVGTRVERGLAHDEAHAAHGGEVLQVSRVAFVVDVGHAHVQGRERELRAMDAGAARHEVEQGERVFAAGQAEQDVVAVVQQMVLGQSFAEMPPDTAFQELCFRGLHAFMGACG